MRADFRAPQAALRATSDVIVGHVLKQTQRRCLVFPRRTLGHLPLRQPIPLDRLRCSSLRTGAAVSGKLRLADARPYSISAPSSGADQAELIISLTEADHGALVQDVLKQQLPPNNPKVLLARLSDGRYLSLQDPIPADASSLTPLTFDSADPAARHAFWLSSAYLLGIAIQEVLGDKVVLAASPSLNAAGAGGAGFAYEYLIERGNRVPPGHSSTSSSPSESAAASAISLIESQDGSASVSEAELKQITKRLEKLASANLSLRKGSMSVLEARQRFSSNPFKAEKVEALAAKQGPDSAIPVVRIGEDYVDLLPSLDTQASADTVIASSKPIKAVEISEWSAATWTPSDPSSALSPPKKQALTRLRAVSFPTPAQLKSHVAAREAALASDHRTIGKAQSLFLTHESSPGTPFILPHGMRLARKVERVVRDLYDVYGYDEVQSPQLYRSSLWKKSGHWDNYRDDMFASEGYKERSARQSSPTASSSIEGRSACCSIDNVPDKGKGKEIAADEDEEVDSFGLKPMNCPGHCLIFASQERSYRDLPIRYAEFSPLHRNEASGSLSGLTRVRRFHQDDAHVFCRTDQVSSEIERMLAMLSSAYDSFGFQSFELVLSTRPPNFIGEVAEWDAAESGLKAALDASGRAWALNEADGAFYGPKIDIRLVDAAGRKHQTATIQLDFQLPQRFDLGYADSDGGRTRPVMIHRAILGSVERFMAILIEQTSGWWPFWLSPRQAIVLPASKDAKVLDYAEEVRTRLSLGLLPSSASSAATSADDAQEQKRWSERPLQRFYIDIDHSPKDKLAKMVRSAQLARYNFVLVVGEEERQQGTVSVRVRDDANAPEGIRRLRQIQLQALMEDGSDDGRLLLDALKGSGVKVEDLRRAFCKLDSLQCW